MPIVTLEKMGDYRLEVPVEESLLQGIRAGQRVTVELDAASGGIVRKIPDSGGGPVGITSNGTYVWVTDSHGSGPTQIDAATGAVLQNPPSGATGDPASDATSLWSEFPASFSGPGIMQRNVSTGALVRTIPLSASWFGIAADGAHLWVANGNARTVTELSASTGNVIRTIPVKDAPYGITADGSNVWTANSNSGTVTKIDGSTGTVIGTVRVGRDPTSISSAGGHVWVVNSADRTVMELNGT